MAAQTNGHVPSTATGAITRTPSFAPISPVVKERVGDVATRLSEVERIIDDINLQSAKSTTRSPTMGDLQHEIGLLKKEIDDTRVAQKKQIDAMKSNVRNDLKDQITKAMRVEIEKKIKESVKSQVKISVEEWGRSEYTKKFVESLRNVVKENDALRQEAQIKLENSRSRHDNSTLDEHADFETNLSKIKLPDGSVSNAFPRTMKALFAYDENQLIRLFDDYGLQTLDTHLENLNRFLAFIGLRFSIPEQSLDFLDNPPAYANSSEVPKEENPAAAPLVPSPIQVEKNDKEMPKVQPESESFQDPAATDNEPAQAEEQEKQVDEKLDEKKDTDQNGVQQHRTVQKQAEIELTTFPPQQSAPTMNNRPQHSSPIQPARLTHRLSIPPVNTPPQQPSTPGGKGVGGWLRSIADGF